MHHPVAIANYFIEKSKKGLTLMQLLKLAYISHGVSLAVYDNPLSKEFAQAWPYGPVFPSMYHAFKFCGPNPIKKKWYNDDLPNLMVDDENLNSNFSIQDKEIMDVVYEKYGHLDGWKLSSLTHAKDAPWYTTYYEGDTPGKDYYGVSISNKKIQEHFEGLLRHEKSQKLSQGATRDQKQT